MRDWFTISEDPSRGVRTRGRFEADGRLMVRLEQEVPEQFFTENAHLAEGNTHASRLKNSMSLVARIPQGLKQKWLDEKGLVDRHDGDPEVDKLIRSKLNSNEYRKLRTGGGRI